MKDRRTAHERLETISNIRDKDARIRELRDECFRENTMAILIQYIYHPNFDLGMPDGEIPETIVKFKDLHDDYGALFRALRKLRNLTNLPKKTKERLFVEYYEIVAVSDRPIMIALKDKKLPWKSLSKEFCAEALPELFQVEAQPDDV